MKIFTIQYPTEIKRETTTTYSLLYTGVVVHSRIAPVWEGKQRHHSKSSIMRKVLEKWRQTPPPKTPLRRRPHIQHPQQTQWDNAMQYASLRGKQILTYFTAVFFPPSSLAFWVAKIMQVMLLAKVTSKRGVNYKC